MGEPKAFRTWDLSLVSGKFGRKCHKATLNTYNLFQVLLMMLSMQKYWSTEKQ